jgi:hypothetical protein
MPEKIIPSAPETLLLGMNDLDSPKVLQPNEWQLIENSFPGITGKPRNGLKELINDLTEKGYNSQPVIFRPHAASMRDSTGKVWLFVITQCRGDSYLSEYAIEVWDPVLMTRNVLEAFKLSNDFCYFGFEKIYNGLYVVFDYGVTTNHTNQYRKTNMVIEWSGSSWTVRSMAVDTSPSIATIATGDSATAGILKNNYCSIATTFVKRVTSIGSNISVFEEPAMESMENLANRQYVQMVCSTTYGQLQIPIPSNYASAVAQGATHMRVWRTISDPSLTVAQGLSLRYLVDIALTGSGFDPANIYNDNTSDVTLTGELNYLNTTGYIIPPQGRFIKWVNNSGVLMIGGNPKNQGYWFYSAIPQNTAFPQKYASMFNASTQYITCDPYDSQNDTGCEVLAGNLYLFKERKIFILDNASFANVPRRIASTIGCAFPCTLQAAYIPQLGGDCLVFLSEAGPAYIDSSGNVHLLTSFRVGKIWPSMAGVMQTPQGVVTDWYSRNKVISSFWNNAWYIAYGDTVDPLTYFTSEQVVDSDGNALVDSNGDLVVSMSSTSSIIGFMFGNDGKSIGGFKISIANLLQGDNEYVLFEPAAMIAIDNLSLYAFSHKTDQNNVDHYRLANLFNPGNFQDEFIKEGALSYSMNFRTRYLLAGALKASHGILEYVLLYLYFQDDKGLSITAYSDGARLVSPCTFSQVRQSGMAADNTFRHFIMDLIKPGMPGSFFDVLVSKVVPADGAVEFIGVELMIGNPQDLPKEEFMTASGALTGSTVFVVEADSSPEVPAFP